MNAEETSEAVRNYLDEHDIGYQYNSKAHGLDTGFRLNCMLQAVKVHYQFLDDGYALYGIAPINAPSENLVELLKYMAMINYGIAPGSFEVDIRDGEMRFKMWTRTKGAEKMSEEVVEDGLRIIQILFERFGNGLAAVALGLSDAATAYNTATEKSS